MTGTVLYAAPEILLGEAPAKPADIWCFGVCLHFMLCGSLPQGHTKQGTPSIIAKRPVNLLEDTWQKTSDQCRSLVMMVLSLDESVEQLLRFTWFNQD